MLPRARGGVTHHTPARRARRRDAFPTAHAHCTSIACKVEDRHCHPRKGVKDRIRSAPDGTLRRLCIVGIAAVLVRAFLRAFLGRRFVCVGIVPRRISRIGMLTLRCFLPLLLPARIVRILRVSVPIVAFRRLRGCGHLRRRTHAVRQDVERRLLHIGGQEIGASREGGNRACRLREKQLRAVARTAHPHDELRRKRAHRGGNGNIRKTLPRRRNRRAELLLRRTIVRGKRLRRTAVGAGAANDLTPLRRIVRPRERDEHTESVEHGGGERPLGGVHRPDEHDRGILLRRGKSRVEEGARQ